MARILYHPRAITDQQRETLKRKLLLGQSMAMVVITAACRKRQRLSDDDIDRTIMMLETIKQEWPK